MNEIILDEEKKSAVVLIEGSATIQNSLSLKQTFLESLRKADHIFINHDKAEDFDLSYLQLLTALRKSAVDAGKKVSINSTNPESFTALIKGSGFSFSFDAHQDFENGKREEN